MSKMSKMQSLKQEKKYRNETIHILNHMNKLTTPSLAGNSLGKFKSARPEVQSSRLTRPDTAKLYGKQGEKKLDVSERMEKMSSKSLESRQGSIHSHRRETDKTKKNSCAKVQREETRTNDGDDWQAAIIQVESSLVNRLRGIEQVFLGQRRQPRGAWQHVEDLKSRFNSYERLAEERKHRMLYDEVDAILGSILGELKLSFLQVVDRLLQENEQKMLDIEMALQKITSEQQQQVEAQSREMSRAKELHAQQVEELLIRSLYFNDKINTLQEKGLLNFELEARRIDAQY